ncbi:Methyl-accepting chemotaxis protein III [Pigmentiphaga humi]|uniref:Methyl-accepting chemotaxis protein III n=1 Tax=Pigmentiphaga humi TaxID=2478468 RepID=A0A3P4B3S6_9BURK|nr:methyl-accepting chemotaxis protein [Pigmentiphaga humi]VCU70957.1 Methyl-accepting chemotaxis protein III [Pigmentiphaga humi]
MKIRSKLFALGTAGIVALVVVAGCAVAGLLRLSGAVDDYAQRRVPALVALGALREGQVQIARHSLEPLQWADEYSIEARNEWERMLQSKGRTWAAMEAARAALSEAPAAQGESEALDAFDAAFHAWAEKEKPLTDLLAQLVEAETEERQRFLFLKYLAAYSAQESYYVQAQQAMQALAEAGAQAAAERAAELRQASRRLAAMIAGIGLAAMLLVLAGAWRIGRTIVGAIDGMRARLAAIADDLDFRPRAAARGNDEVADMARALDRLVARVRTSLATMQDLSATMNAAGNEVSAGAAGVAGGAARQSDAAGRMAESMQTVAASMTQVAGSVEEAIGLSREACGLARHGGELIGTAGERMDVISGRMTAASRALDALDRHGESIRHVARLISDIAGQTKLLSLNAAIEAARAGEDGRGFAVVAEQVRTLAEKSAASSLQIGQTVERIADETAAAAELMREVVEAVAVGQANATEAGRFVGELSAASERAARVVAAIGQALREQSSLNDGVARHVDDVAGMAGHYREAAGAMAAQAASLQETVRTVDATVNSFRVS